MFEVSADIDTEANNVPRETIFLTSKLKSLRSYDKTLSDLRSSLKRTGVPYFDLYLLHSAIGGPQVRKECWRACVDAQKEGLVKSIGVSNWGTKHIQELLDNGSVLPVVNQIDLHPFMRHPDIVKICRDNGILLEVSPPVLLSPNATLPERVVKGTKLMIGMGTTSKSNAIRSPVNSKSSQSPREISSPDLPQVGTATCMSSSLFPFPRIFRIIEEADLQGYIVIPKSVSEERIISNSEVFDFELSPEEMEEVSQYSTKSELG